LLRDHVGPKKVSLIIDTWQYVRDTTEQSRIIQYATMEDLKGLLAEATAAQQKLTSAIQAAVAMEQASRNEGYVGIADLLAVLGPAFTKRKIEEDLRAGMFKHGRDYINLSNGTRPTYGFKISKIKAVYETDPTKRKVYT
jgi:hypothetical protein